jgi:hypothetical protein
MLQIPTSIHIFGHVYFELQKAHQVCDSVVRQCEFESKDCHPQMKSELFLYRPDSLYYVFLLASDQLWEVAERSHCTLHFSNTWQADIKFSTDCDRG